MYTQISGKETIKSQYNFVNKILTTILGFLNRVETTMTDNLSEMMASLSMHYLNLGDSKHSHSEHFLKS